MPLVKRARNDTNRCLMHPDGARLDIYSIYIYINIKREIYLDP